MEKLLENVQKELKQIEEQGINTSNIEILSKLVDVEKDIYEIMEKKEEGGKAMMYGEYSTRGGRGGRYSERGYGANYNNSGYGRGGNYRGNDDRMYQHLDRIMEGADEYQYGRNRYMDGGTEDRMQEGLEKLMYAICVFVESMVDFAETPEEKEIIRRHIHKIKGM